MIPQRRGWRVVDAVWALLAGLVGAVIGVLIVGADAGVAALFGIVVPFQTLATIGAVAALARRSDRVVGDLRLQAEPDDGWGLVVGAGLQFGLALLMYPLIVLFFDDEVPVQEIVETADQALTSGERFLVAFGAVILAPIAEELVFRGVLLAALRDRFSDGRAILLSSAGFAAFHLLDPGAFLAVGPLFVLGLVMARQVVRTGRLGRAVFTHMGFNLVSVIALFVTV